MNSVSHKGKIINITPQNIFVAIESKSNCVACSIREKCTLLDCKEKIIKVPHNPSSSYQIDEMVTVTISDKQAWLGVFLGYILPLLLILSVIIIGNIFNIREMYLAFLSLVALIPYYLLLFIFRKHLVTKFDFRIEK